MTSTKLIRKGEELFVDYTYDLSDSDVPRWYIELYEETYGPLDAALEPARKIVKEAILQSRGS